MVEVETPDDLKMEKEERKRESVEEAVLGIVASLIELLLSRLER
jgi:hypothetical protein